MREHFDRCRGVSRRAARSVLCCVSLLWCGVPLLAPLVTRPLLAADNPPQDTVEFASLATEPDAWVASPAQRLAGEVLELDSQSLRILVSGGEERSIPAAQIVRIEPRWRSEAAADARQLARERKYREVIEAVPEALKSGLPRWQQQLLLADLVVAAEALGNRRTAGVLFLNLSASDPAPFLYGVMPLCWSGDEPDPVLKAEAEKWLGSSQEAAQLLGASWLLATEKGAEAASKLTALKASSHHVLAHFAVVQAWRVVPPPEVLGKLGEWFEFRERLVQPLQLGPTEVIAERLMRAGESELAIGQWMRIAAVHGDRYHRAAQALEAAAMQLRRLGREDEALRVNPWIDELRSGR